MSLTNIAALKADVDDAWWAYAHQLEHTLGWIAVADRRRGRPGEVLARNSAWFALSELSHARRLWLEASAELALALECQ
jgi:hypothetical protein